MSLAEPPGTNMNAEMGAHLTIGLVNSMPDAALQQTERQFRRLAGEATIAWRRYSLPGIPRGAAVAAHVATRYDDLEAIAEHGLDALILTGAEPCADDLRDEPFWPALAALLDWSEARGLPLLLSCLAAHAAALHRDGIQRRRLPAKCSGVFGFDTSAHALLDGLPGRIDIVHSRLNEVPEDALSAAGWQILSRSPTRGVDAFMREGGAPWVCWQGHPEYEADTLLLEFRRDLRRFLLGEREVCPAIPAMGLPAADRAAFDALRARAIARREESLLAELPRPTLEAASWHGTACRLFTNWLGLVERARMPPTLRAHAQAAVTAAHAAHIPLSASGAASR